MIKCPKVVPLLNCFLQNYSSHSIHLVIPPNILKILLIRILIIFMMSVLRKNPSCIPWLGEIEGRDAGVGRRSSLTNKEGLETCVICCIVYYSYCCRISCYCSNYHIFDMWLLSYLVLETNKTFFLIMMMVVPVSPSVSVS